LSSRRRADSGVLSLYKVLFGHHRNAHAPFYGWIKDLSAAGSDNLFNLFGLFHFRPDDGRCSAITSYSASWPIIMGITMWFQMKLNPTPAGSDRRLIFD